MSERGKLYEVEPKRFNLEQARKRLKENWDNLPVALRRLALVISVASIVGMGAGLVAVREHQEYERFEGRAQYEIVPGVDIIAAGIGGDQSKRCVFDLVQNAHVLKDIQGACQPGESINIINTSSQAIEYIQNLDKIEGIRRGLETVVIEPGDAKLWVIPNAIESIRLIPEPPTQ